jgi:hypothetical protein
MQTLTTPSTSDGSHRFNTDLLINPGELESARLAFPRIVHILDHPALRQAFIRFDRPSNAAKKKGRIAGLLAIALGMVSLAIAAAAPDIRALGLFAALCGVASIVIGLGGALYAGAKRRWLCNRLMTERLRQFHFQAFVCRWREIGASLAAPDKQRDYSEQRETWFNRLIAPFPGQLDSELTDLLDDDTAERCWLHPSPRLPGPDEDTSSLKELFVAYRELRILHQLHYANYKLREEQDMFSWSPRLQDAIFSNTILICILAIFVLHLCIAFSIAVGARIGWLESGINVHIVVIWIAILALGFRALQEGLQPEREIERYRHYRASLRAVRDRFDKAVSAAEIFEIMLEMERLSFDEMRNFLRSNNEARFLL